jgi:hypothetical protein
MLEYIFTSKRKLVFKILLGCGFIFVLTTDKFVIGELTSFAKRITFVMKKD